MMVTEDKSYHSKCPSALPFFLPQLLTLNMMGLEYSLGQLGSVVPAVSSSSFVCTPSLLAGGVGPSRKGLDCVQPVLSTKENTPELPTYFPAQMQNTAPYKVLWRKLSVCQLKPTQSEKFYIWSKFRLSNPDSDKEFWHISLHIEETCEMGGRMCSTQCYPNATYNFHWKNCKSNFS